LFPTREACIEFYQRPENFAKLEMGEIGDNLMYKYRAIASFHLWPEICATAMNTTRKIVEDRGIADGIPHFEEFWRDFHAWMEYKHAHGKTREEILAPAAAVLNYDFDSWLASGEYSNPGAYRLEEPQLFEFVLSEENVRELSAALNVWTVELKGLTKMVTRIKVAWQIRDCAPAGVMTSAALA